MKQAKRKLALLLAVVMLSMLFGGLMYVPAKATQGTGTLQMDEDGVWKYYVDGEVDTSYTGLAEYEGALYYVSAGILDWSYAGVAETPDGVMYIVTGGIAQSSIGEEELPDYVKELQQELEVIDQKLTELEEKYANFAKGNNLLNESEIVFGSWWTAKRLEQNQYTAKYFAGTVNVDGLSQITITVYVDNGGSYHWLYNYFLVYENGLIEEVEVNSFKGPWTIEIPDGVNEVRFNMHSNDAEYLVQTMVNKGAASLVYEPYFDGGVQSAEDLKKQMAEEIHSVREEFANLKDVVISLSARLDALENASGGAADIPAMVLYNGISNKTISTGGNNFAVYRLHELVPADCGLRLTLNIVQDCPFYIHYVDTDGNVLYAEEFLLSAGENVVQPDFVPEEDYYLCLSAEAKKIYYAGTGTMPYQYYSSQSGYWEVGDTVSVKTPAVSAEFAVKMELVWSSVGDAVGTLLAGVQEANDRIDQLEAGGTGSTNEALLAQIEEALARIEELEAQVESGSTGQSSSPLEGKIVFLAGDSRSSTDYTFYESTLEAKCGCDALVQGASGRNAAYNASDAYFARLAANPHDFSIWIVGGNDTGAAGTIGTFRADSPNGLNGEKVVEETDITQDYSGTYFVQAIDHIMRKYKALYYDFKGLDNGHKPIMIFCTDLPQQRYSASHAWSLEENWERKRQAIIECAEKNDIILLDLYDLCNFDMSYEPFWVSPTDKVNDNGLYFMDGLHPNQYGIDIITSLEIQEMLKYVTINPYFVPADMIEEGLVMWCDGINNTGEGHSDAVTSWVDLSGNGNELMNVISATAEEPVRVVCGTWEEDGFSVDVSMNEYLRSSGEFDLGADRTVEIRVTPLSSAYMEIGFDTAERIKFRTNGANWWIRLSQAQSGESLVDINVGKATEYNEPITVSITRAYDEAADTTTYVVYVNGLQVAKKTVDGNYRAGETARLLFGGENAHATIHSVRVYERALTADEVKNNYKHDVQNFGS